MKHSESITTIAAALVAVSAEVTTIVNDSTGDIPTKGGGKYSYRYAGLPKVTETLRPILTKHGITVLQGTTTPDSGPEGLIALTVETTLLHKSGEWVQTTAVIPVSQSTAQGAGSAITYGRRYGLLAAVGVATDDDDDGAAASQPRERSAPKPAANNPQRSAAANGVPSLPFGKSKGKALADMTTDDLEGALKWAQDTKPGVYAAFEEAAALELDKRRVGATAGGPNDDADLPF